MLCGKWPGNGNKLISSAKESSFFTMGKDDASGTLGSGPGPLGHPGMLFAAVRCELVAAREELLVELPWGGAICCSLRPQLRLRCVSIFRMLGGSMLFSEMACLCACLKIMSLCMYVCVCVSDQSYGGVRVETKKLIWWKCDDDKIHVLVKQGDNEEISHHLRDPHAITHLSTSVLERPILSDCIWCGA